MSTRIRTALILALSFTAAACGDNLEPSPDAADPALVEACTIACAFFTPEGALCPGADHAACFFECLDGVADVAWCP